MLGFHVSQERILLPKMNGAEFTRKRTQEVFYNVKLQLLLVQEPLRTEPAHVRQFVWM